MILAIDGGKDPGAIGPSGVQEKVVTLAVAQKAAAIFRGAGFDVVLTRTTDSLLSNTINIDLGMRCKLANQAKADVFVSIHCNSAADNRANGTEVFCYTGSATGQKLAAAIHARLIPALGLRDRGVKQANFAVLRRTNMPAALVELAFISNPTEESLLQNPGFQQKAVQAIAEGVFTFLGAKPKESSEAGAGTVRIQVNGKVLIGIIMDKRTFAPVREFGNALGYSVSWDAQKGVTVGGVVVSVKVVGNVSYAPVRYLAESLGKRVTWYGGKVVII